MKRRSLIKGVVPAALAAGPSILYAESYLTVEQARQLLFPKASFTSAEVTLTKEQKKEIEKAAKVNVRESLVKAWRVGGGGWFIVDSVVGKHEFIDIALGLNADGSVKGIEILTYRETYGTEVRNPKWRAQFTGKTTAQPVKIDSDIKNISGATLSSVHVAEGVRRLLHTWAIALRAS